MTLSALPQRLAELADMQPVMLRGELRHLQQSGWPEGAVSRGA